MIVCRCGYNLTVEEAEMGKKDVVYEENGDLEIIIECPECGKDNSIYTSYKN